MASTVEIGFAGIRYSIDGVNLEEETGPFLDGFRDAAMPGDTYTVKLDRDPMWEEREPSFQTTPAWNKEALKVKLSFCDAEVDFAKRSARILTGENIGLFGLLRFLSAMHLVRNGGFLLHAASVLGSGGSYVFTGVSGSGKTTISALAKGHLKVLTDETTAICKNGGSFEAHATPFAGDLGNIGVNAGGRIRALFFIEKDGRFRHRRMEGAETVKRLFQNIILTVADRSLTDLLFDSVSLFAKEVPCYELGFRISADIWRYIDGITG